VINQRTYVEMQGRKRPLWAEKLPKNSPIFAKKWPVFDGF
jgi:hypothetical protein